MHTDTSVRTSQLSDIDAMVLLSKAKRLAYEKSQPQFWRHAGEEGNNAQRQWFTELLEDKNYVMFTAESNPSKGPREILGQIILIHFLYTNGCLEKVSIC
jgi:hypothetical protein